MPRLFRPARAAPAAQPLADGGFVCVALPLRGGGDATAAPRAAQPVSQLARAVVAPMKGRVIEAPNPKSPLEQFRVLKIDGDGRCMFRATVQGLASLRGLVCGPAMETREADLLRVAVAEALCTTPDARAAHPDAMFAVKVEFKDLKSYCTRLASPRFWGGEAEMLVLASILKQPIAVRSAALAVRERGALLILVSTWLKHALAGVSARRPQRRVARRLQKTGDVRRPVFDDEVGQGARARAAAVQRVVPLRLPAAAAVKR